MDLPYTYSGDSIYCNNENKNYRSDNNLTRRLNVYSELETSVESCKPDWADPPVEIHEECTTDIDLPLLSWHGYDILPKILSVCNTGRTIAINGQWVTGRPYLEGGPLNGKYIFSQIHFHCPSEHEIDGRRYPLEMHVVHFKTSYLTQERAMHEKDGTLVLVYLFQAVEAAETILSRVVGLSSCLEKPNARVEIRQFRLCELVKPFFCNYYVYWGSVKTKKTSYILQWLINCGQLSVTKDELSVLFSIMSTCKATSTKKPKMKPLNSIIYRVGESYEVISECVTKNTDAKMQTVIDSTDTQQTPCVHAHPCRSRCLHQCPHFINKEAQTIQSQHTVEPPCQKLCSTCGGVEAESPKYMCKCHPKERKVCSSCGGSKSGISWCKEKWKRCKSKCSLFSKTSFCSSVGSFRDKKKKKRKPAKKPCKRLSSGSSCRGRRSHTKKSCSRLVHSKSNEKKLAAEKCPPKNACTEPEDACTEPESACSEPESACSEPESACSEPESACNEPEYAYSEPEYACSELEKTYSERSVYESCDIPSKRNSSVTFNCGSSSIECSSAPEACTKKKKKKPKTVRKRTSVTVIKSVEKDESTDVVNKKSKNVKRKHETKTPSREHNKLKHSAMKSRHKASKKVSSKDSVARSQISSDKENQKKRIRSQKSEEVTTLFVKTPDKVFPVDNFSCSEVCFDEKKVTEDVKLDYLEENKDEDNGENENEEHVIQSITAQELETPKDLASKVLSFQMRHCFSSEKKDSSQEYQVSIYYDSNVVQEYSGVFQPQDISLGSREKLHLVPKYEELDDLSVRLEECIIQKPSLDKFCIDSKFLLKRWTDRENVLANMKSELIENFNDRILNCSIVNGRYASGGVTTVCSVCRSVQTDESYPPGEDKLKRSIDEKSSLKSQTVQTESLDEKWKMEKPKDLRTCKTKVLRTVSEPEFPKALNKFRRKQSILESRLWKLENLNSSKASIEKLKCKIKLLKNAKNLRENNGAGSSTQNLGGKNDLGTADKNTVYFMYDKVEKDPLTGKKIFMGRFRTKDDLRILKEHKITSLSDSLKSFGSRSTSDKSTSAESEFLKHEKLNSFLNTNLSKRSEQQSLPPANKEVSEHKFEASCLNLTQFKAQNPKPVVADVVKWFQDDGENFEILAEIIGIDKKVRSKNSEPRTREREPFTTGNGNLASKSHTNRDKAGTSSGFPLAAKFSKNADSCVGLKTSDSNTIVFVPVEVDSWSKIDVVFIERPDDNKEIKSSKKYIPLS